MSFESSTATQRGSLWLKGLAKSPTLQAWLWGMLVCLVSVHPISIAAANAATVTAKASVDTVQVAEPFRVELVVTAPVGSKVNFPSNANKLGAFDVLETRDVFDVPSQDTSQVRIWTRYLTLESIESGEQQIPALDVQVSHGQEETLLHSRPITIRVASVLEDRSDPTKFRDIQPVFDIDIPVEKSTAWMWWWGASAIGIAALALVGLVATRRRRWIKPKDWACAELDELEATCADSAVASGAAAQRLSDIVRSYLLLQFNIVESGRTPQELLQVVESNNWISGATVKRLGSLFQLSDGAKFAGLELSTGELLSALNEAREVIDSVELESQLNRRA
jgi:hypothetical protein